MRHIRTYLQYQYQLQGVAGTHEPSKKQTKAHDPFGLVPRSQFAIETVQIDRVVRDEGSLPMGQRALLAVPPFVVSLNRELAWRTACALPSFFLLRRVVRRCTTR